MIKEEECYICKSISEVSEEISRYLKFYTCPVCGRYEIPIFEGSNVINKNHLGAYLIYHKYLVNSEYRYNTTLEKEECDKYKEEFNKGNNVCGIPVHMDNELVEARYPRSFAERVDNILLIINKRASHIGQRISFSLDELISILFVDRYDIAPVKYGNQYDNSTQRDREERSYRRM